jgi:Putative beta-barrel porin-2, OmpL-like. bbp2
LASEFYQKKLLSFSGNLPIFETKCTTWCWSKLFLLCFTKPTTTTNKIGGTKMKFNKWTLGLAAVGAVSMASAVRADEAAKLSVVNTALSATTLSGYVDVAANIVAPHQITGVHQDSRFDGYSGYFFYNNGYQTDNRDQFSLNSVTISLDKPLDDTSWSAGYHIDINAGSSAIDGVSSHGTYAYYGEGNSYQNPSPAQVLIRQAYVTLRTPVGAGGIDWKIGAIDGITGYEGNTAYANPNYSRSYGYAINPASYVGALGTYKFTSAISATAGVVNRGTSLASYGQSNQKLGDFDYVASVSLTAPDSWGFLKGSSLNVQTIQGFDNYSVDNYSVSATINTPMAGLKVGVVWDAVQAMNPDYYGAYSYDGNIYGLYATYQATDKLGFKLRGEYVDATDLFNSYGPQEEVTATLEYDLWANVTSRAEFRWDHVEHYNGGYANTFGLALNVVYKF